MKKKILAVLFVSLFASLARADGGSSSAGAGAHGSIVGADTQFGNSLLRAVARQELAKDPNKNVFISPLSVTVTLQMLLNGAGPESPTYTEMLQALSLKGIDLKSINEANKSLLASLETPGATHPVNGGEEPRVPFTLKIANSLWSDSAGAFAFKLPFVDTLASSYGAQASVADFKSQSGADAINGWASQNTQGKVPSVIDARTLSGLSSLIMNAVYFKANWQEPFVKDFTSHHQKFQLANGGAADIELMNSERYGYSETVSAQVMELPYEGNKASMYVVLPKAGAGVSDVLDDADGPLSQDFWAKLSAGAKGVARFSMPKFGFSYAIKLNSVLSSLGMRALFSPTADLSGLGNLPTHIDLVKQNSFVNVDEAGTEAAAVTIAATAGSAAGPRPAVMRADRPFLVAIVEKTTGSILFMGVISDPSSK